MSAIPEFLDPRKNPLWQAWEKTSTRLTQTALTDPFFLATSSALLKGMLTAVKMQEQWWSLVTTGSVPSSTRDAKARSEEA